MAYMPDRGDIVWLDFNPQTGREQEGRRPALVITPDIYNGKTQLMVCCPITSRVKGYPFEVLLPSEFPLKGVILADQLKRLDWAQRRAEFKAQAPDEVLSETLQKLAALLGFRD